MSNADNQIQWGEELSRRYLDPDDIDKPSRLFDQLNWLEQAGFSDIDVHFMQAGHALFSGWKVE